MSYMNFTPGPWGLEEGRTKRLDHINVVHYGNKVGGAGAVIAKVTCRVSWLKEQNANARLIAAAPDLFVELHQAVMQLEMAAEAIEAGRYDEALLHANGLMRHKKEALAKARGEL